MTDRFLLASSLLLLTSLSASAQSISGTVFEDINYGGGAGRSMATANSVKAGSAVAVGTAATVELYTASGTYLTNTTTSTAAATLGQYTFGGLTSGTGYIVRVVNQTVRSTRTGATAALLPVQTFVVRNGAADGNRVGGEQPSSADAAANTTSAALTSIVAQSQAPVTATSGATTGVDFGFCFDVVVNTNGTGQGSLQQFLLNANALTDNSTLQQVGQTAQRETSIFMISDGAAHPGLRAGLISQLTGSTNSAVAVITLTTLLTASDAGTVIDGTTQTANVGNTNTTTLGTGGTVGTGALTLDKVNGPEVELSLARSTTTTMVMLNVTGSQCTLRGLAIHGGYVNVQWSGADALVEGNVLGCTATTVALPSSNTYSTALVTTATTGTVRNNLIGYAGRSGINYSASTGSTGIIIRDNELVQNGQIAAGGDNISVGDNGAAGPMLIEGNLLSTANSSGIQLEVGSISNNIIRNNTIVGNGTGGTNTRKEGSGIHYLARNETVNSSNSDLITLNVIYNNQSSGVVLNYGQRNVRITQNSIYQNGNGTTGGQGLLSIDYTGPNGYVRNSSTNAAGDANYGQGDGVTPNDGLLDAPGTTAVPPHRQGNGGLDYPIITSISKESGTSLRIQGYIGSARSQSQFGGATVEVFSANNADTNQNGPIIVGDGQSVAHGEAQYYVGTITADADGSFNAVITNPARSISSGDNITATAYLADYGTSECGTNQVSNFNVLPVKLVSFTAQATVQGAALLRWVTASEINSKAFGIERQLAGGAWEPLAYVAATNGLTGSNYAFTDHSLALAPAATQAYYRLRQEDFDGTLSYSPVAVVARPAATGAASPLVLSPVPVSEGSLSLFFAEAGQAGTEVTVSTAQGQRLLHLLTAANAEGSFTLPVASLAPGVYLVCVQVPGQAARYARFVKQ